MKKKDIYIYLGIMLYVWSPPTRIRITIVFFLRKMKKKKFFNSRKRINFFTAYNIYNLRIPCPSLSFEHFLEPFLAVGINFLILNCLLRHRYLLGLRY